MTINYKAEICKLVVDGEVVDVARIAARLRLHSEMAERLVGQLVRDGTLSRRGDELSVKNAARAKATALGVGVSLSPTSRVVPETSRPTLDAWERPVRRLPEPKVAPPFIPTFVTREPVIAMEVGEQKPVGVAQQLSRKVVIEHGIPIPDADRGRVTPWPLAQMEIGDSFAVAVPESARPQSIASTLRKAAGNYRMGGPRERRFVVRVEAGDKSVRIWRVEDDHKKRKYPPRKSA